MSPATFLLLLSALLLAAALIKILLLLREKKALLVRLKLTETRLRAINGDVDTLRARISELQNFRDSLDQAELTTRLQRPRLETAAGEATARKTSPPATEKYRFIHALAEKDLSGKEIASILAVSQEEVQQVLALTALSSAAETGSD